MNIIVKTLKAIGCLVSFALGFCGGVAAFVTGANIINAIDYKLHPNKRKFRPRR